MLFRKKNRQVIRNGVSPYEQYLAAARVAKSNYLEFRAGRDYSFPGTDWTNLISCVDREGFFVMQGRSLSKKEAIALALWILKITGEGNAS
jgi:hypothetical protein